MQDAVFIFMGVVFGILAGWYLASRHAHRLASLETVESRLLAANQRQRQAISTGSSTAPGPKAVRDEPASPRRTLS